MEDFSNETAEWLADRIEADAPTEIGIGVLIAAASGWTEDEAEIDDLVSGLVETGHVTLQIA